MANQISNQHEEQLLNSWFVAILWVKIVFTSLSVIAAIWEIFTNSNDILLDLGNILLAIGAILGAYLLLKAKKMGFYLIVLTNIILAMLSYYQFTQISVDEYGMMYNLAQQSAFKGVWGSLGQIIFIMLLMLLKKDGRNAYQVIWNH